MCFLSFAYLCDTKDKICVWLCVYVLLAQYCIAVSQIDIDAIMCFIQFLYGHDQVVDFLSFGVCLAVYNYVLFAIPLGL